MSQEQAQETKASPTPGPWEARYDRRNGWSIIGGHERLANGSMIRREVVTRFPEWRPDTDNGANASLIAAAPHMLAVLRGIVAEPLDDPTGDDRETLERFVEHARAAIAKAEGRSDA